MSKRSYRDFDPDNYDVSKRQKRYTKDTLDRLLSRNSWHIVDRPDDNTIIVEDRNAQSRNKRYAEYEKATFRKFMDTGELQPYVGYRQWRDEIDKYPIKSLARAVPINRSSSEFFRDKVFGKGNFNSVTDNYELDIRSLPKLPVDVVSHIRSFLS